MRRLALVVLLVAAGPARAERLSLGSYERASLAEALAARGLELEPQPEGKRLGRIHVVNLDVFGADEGFLTWFNTFHRTTREDAIEREVLLRPGELWDDGVIEDTQRRLRDPLFTSLVVLAAVRAAAPGEVDLLVVTRDVWSLRMNSLYEVQGGTLTELSLSISENNFLGRRKQLAFVFDLDQGTYTLSPQYVDKNVLGTRLQFVSKAGVIFARDGGELEGTRSVSVLSYPLWSLRREWGAAVSLSHLDAVVRSFLGTELRTYDNPDTVEVEELPYVYQHRLVNLETVATRSVGLAVKQNFSFGHELIVSRPAVTDDFPGDAVAQEAFEDDVLPRSERSSALLGRYVLNTPRYQTFREVDNYDLPEEERLGPSLSAELAVARTELGSEQDFARGTVIAGWAVALGSDSLARVSGTASGRLQDGELIDQQLIGSLYAATPRLLGAVRLVGAAVVAARLDETQNRFYALGGSNGLRGYPIGAFTGQVFLRTNLELRSLPRRLLFTRVGGLLFWDTGHAAASWGDVALQHDLGLGVRLLIPQLQPFLFRFDWAVPLTGPGAGLPGRFIAGLGQVF